MKFKWLFFMAQKRVRLSNPVLCNTLGLAVRLRVHGHWSRFLSSSQQSAHPVPVSTAPRQHPQQHPQQQQRNDPLCFTDRRTSFREGPAPHDQASLFIFYSFRILNKSAIHIWWGESGHRWCLFTSSRSRVWGDQKEHSLQSNVFAFLYL